MFSRKKKKEKRHKPGMTEAELSKLEEVGVRRGFFSGRKSSKQESFKKSDISAPRPLGFQPESDKVSLASSQGSPHYPRKNYPDPSSGSQQNGNGDQTDKPSRSVLQKAAMYGDLVGKNKSQSNAPMPVPAQRLWKPQQELPQGHYHPVPPNRKKAPSKSSQPHIPTYDHPPPYDPSPVHNPQTMFPPQLSPIRSPPAAPEKGYSVPTPWLPVSSSASSYFGATDFNGANYDYPTGDNASTGAVFSPPKTSHRLKRVVLRKKRTGDFGFSLRRSSIIEHSGSGNLSKKTVYFAEPGSTMQNSGEILPLSPGDRLIAVDGQNVEDSSRDEIVGMIRAAKDSVTITVQPIPEARELERAMKMKEHRDDLPHTGFQEPSNIQEMKVHVEEKAKDDRKPKIPVPIPSHASSEKEQKEETADTSSKTNTRRSSSSTAEGTDKDDDGSKSENKLRRVSSPQNLGFKVVLGKTKQDGNDDKDSVSTMVVVSPVTPNELHASSMNSTYRPTQEDSANSVDNNEKLSVENGIQNVNSTNSESLSLSNGNLTNGEKKMKKKKVKKKLDKPAEISDVKSHSDKNNLASAHENESTNLFVKTSGEEILNTSSASSTDSSLISSAVAENISLSLATDTQPTNGSVISTSDNPDNTTSDDTSQELPPTDNITETDSNAQQKEVFTPEPVFNDSEWKESDQVWFTQDGNFSSAHLLQYIGGANENGLPEGKARIKLDLSGQTVTVDEEKIEKANPAECDRSEDISSLRYLNECSVLHTLQQRYSGNLVHTYAGPHLVSLCPPHQTSVPSEKVMQMFKGCRRAQMPPHIFSAAQAAYSDMCNTGSDQSLLVVGRSGAGKTQNVHNILRYLTAISGTSNQVTSEKLIAASTILDSFSSAATSQCISASRCVNLYTLNFDKSSQIGSASIQCMLLETSRVVRRPVREENFHIFYQLVEGADAQLSRELFLEEAEQQENPFLFDAENQTPKSELWREECVNGFKKLKSSFELFKFSSDETKAIFNVLAACLHLGVAGSQKVSGSRYQFLKPDAAQKASSLLGVSIENLARAIFQPSASGSRSPASQSGGSRSSASLQRSMSNASMTQGDEQAAYTGQENLVAFVTGLYTEVFRLVVSIINRSLSSSGHTNSSLMVVDIPGMQCPDSKVDTDSTPVYASLEDLAYNYVQERLQLLFHHNAFTRLQDRYQQENVDCEFEPIEGDVNAVVDAIDRPPPQSRSGTNLITDAKGLLWLLDEEALTPGATEESFIERLNLFFGQAVKNSLPLVQKCPKKSNFIMRHMMGTCAVEYDTTNWLRQCRENPVTKTTVEVLQDSKKNFISITFGGRTGSGSLLQGSIVGLDNVGRSLTLRRGASMRKGLTGSGSALNVAAVVKKKSLSMVKKLQVDSLMDALRRTQVHFVFCLTPHRAAAVGQERIVDTPMLTNQLRGFQLLHATRVHKQGYPEHMVYSEFRRCYEVLCRQLGGSKQTLPPVAGGNTSMVAMDDKEATEYILQQSDVERSQYRLGISQVLIRSGILAQLENRRNEKLTSVIVAIQAQCRGYIARKLYEKRKVQVVAIRCIQRNVQKFLVVRQWPWWRLLTKVLPLVEVHRTEEDLREREAELELIKSRYDKVVAERDELKKENEKYEGQLNEVMGELSEEQNTASHASEMLEQETRERMRLERELKELQTYNNNARQRCETMQVELAEQRLLHATGQDDFSDSDEEADAAEYKMRYDRLKRESDFKHKKTMQEYDEKVEQAESDKKHAEKKLHQLQEDLDEQERLTTQHKRKAQRTLAELNDARVHLEETNAKLHELEKKQRKFDSELYAVQAELTETKTAKDRLQREKDQLSMEVYTKRNELEENSGDIEVLQKKIERLEQELDETTTKDTDDGQMLNNLKKKNRELDAKLKDQEEELDEQAGQIQMLQQAKERLEMTAERGRQQHSKEIDGKEEELEEMRISYQKKIKHLENQLEEEEEERSNALKNNRELQQEISNLRDKQPYAKRDAETEKRLRKDLKRYKALLDDAQTMIDHLKTDAVNKQQLKQLKSQLEESQYICSTAVKSKKAIELELEDVQAQLEEISKAKQEAENRISQLQREKHELNSRIEEDGDDAKELAKKYKNLVMQQCEDRKEIVELNSQIDDQKREKETLHEKVLTLQSQLEFMQENTTDKSNVMRLDSKVRDFETKLDFEKTSNRRLEVQLDRLKDQIEKLQSERDSQAASEHREKEQCKRLQKQLRDAKDEQSDILKREQEALQKQRELELELMEHTNQNESLQADLKLAFKRISDLQIAFEDLEDSDLELSGSEDSDSDSDLEGSKIGSWRRSFVPRSQGAKSVSTSSRLSSKHSISDEDFSFRKRPLSPDESKFSDSSTSTVRSIENDKESKKERRQKAKEARMKLLKELKSSKSNGESLDASFARPSSVIGGSSIIDDFARDDDVTGGRSTVLSKISFGRSTGIPETASLCGDVGNSARDFDTISLPDTRQSEGGILSRVGKAGGKNAIKLELDRMSKSLADEDPSVLLYGSPRDIAGNLGLGKTSTFRTLNENIMAVKSRQNLPEKQKKKLAILDKVNQDISSMKDDSGRRSRESLKSSRSSSRDSSRRSYDRDDSLSSYSAFSKSSSDFGADAPTFPRRRNFSVDQADWDSASKKRPGSNQSRFSRVNSASDDDFGNIDFQDDVISNAGGRRSNSRMMLSREPVDISPQWRDRSISRDRSRTAVSSNRSPSQDQFNKDVYGGRGRDPVKQRYQVRNNGFDMDEDSYHTDGEYAAAPRFDRRRIASVSVDNFDDYELPPRLRRVSHSEMDTDQWSMPEAKGEGYPARSRSRNGGYTEPRSKAQFSRISDTASEYSPRTRLPHNPPPGGSGKHLPDYMRSRSRGSRNSDERSSYGFDLDGDDVSLSQYGLPNDDTESNYSTDLVPVRPRSRASTNQDFDAMSSSSSRRGRTQSRQSIRDSRIPLNQRSASVDTRTRDFRPRSSGARSTSRSRMSRPIDNDPTQAADDGDISIDSIISKYLYKT